jgi:single-stranded DNA-binding protein
MSAFALVTGTIFRAPLQKISKAGKPFTACTVKVGADDSASSDFWSIVCFSESGQLELLRLEIGDAVSVRGKFKIELYTANDGTTKISRSIFADACVGLRPTPREKKKAPPAGSKVADAIAKQTILPDATPETAAGGPAFFSDDIPFEAVR